MMRKPSASPESYSGTMWGWARLAREGGLPITDAVRVLRDHPRFQALLGKYET